MIDPAAAPQEGQILGIKLASLLAGFVGGVVSLSFVKQLTRAQAVIAVTTGAVTANYLTDGAMYWLSLPASLGGFASFVIGLTAMNIVPGLLKVSAIFRNNPVGFIRNPKNDSTDGGEK